MKISAVFANCAGGDKQTRIGVSSIARYAAKTPYGGWVLEEVTSEDDDYNGTDVLHILHWAESSARELGVAHNDSAGEWVLVADHAIAFGRSTQQLEIAG